MKNNEKIYHEYCNRLSWKYLIAEKTKECGDFTAQDFLHFMREFRKIMKEAEAEPDLSKWDFLALRDSVSYYNSKLKLLYESEVL